MIAALPMLSIAPLPEEGCAAVESLFAIFKLTINV